MSAAGWVIDSSVVIKWLVEEEGSAQALALAARGEPLFSPALLLAECSNVLWKKVQRRELSPAVASQMLKLLTRAKVTFEPMRPLLTETLRLALALNHPAYDCFYLALAKRRALPFVTADDKLVRHLAANSEQGLKAISLAAVPDD